MNTTKKNGKKGQSALKTVKTKTKGFRLERYIPKLSLDFFKHYINKEYKAKESILVLMLLRNGNFTMFTVTPKQGRFTYLKGTYITDSDQSKHEFQSGMNLYFYHQDVDMPIAIDVDIHKLKSKIEAYAGEVSLAVNPKSLERFIMSEVIERVMKGQELSDAIKFLRMMTILNTVMLAVITLIVLKTSGVLAQLKIPI